MAEAGPRVPHLGRTVLGTREERGSDTRVGCSEAWADAGIWCVSRRAGHAEIDHPGGHIIVSRKKIVTGKEKLRIKRFIAKEGKRCLRRHMGILYFRKRLRETAHAAQEALGIQFFLG